MYIYIYNVVFLYIVVSLLWPGDLRLQTVGLHLRCGKRWF